MKNDDLSNILVDLFNDPGDEGEQDKEVLIRTQDGKLHRILQVGEEVGLVIIDVQTSL